MTQNLDYENSTQKQGQSLQSDVEVDGVNLLQTDGDVDEISLGIQWSSSVSWQGVEAYVIDPDGTQHDIFTAGSLPFGSGQRSDSITLQTADFPTSIDGTWEFYIADQMFNNVDLFEVSVIVKCTNANMPATYSETVWHNADAYRGGIDLTNNQRHVYPLNGATITADSGSGGTNAFSFDGTDDVWQHPEGNTTFDNVTTCSWSMWVKPDQLTTKKMVYCNHGYRKGNWQVYLNGATVNFFVGYYDPGFSSSDGMRTYANTINTSNQWYHIAAVFDGSEPLADRIKIWIDNQSETTTNIEYGNGVTSIPATNPITGVAAPLSIGGLVDVSLGGVPSGTIRFPFDGLVDDCRCWPNYKLTADDRTWLYSGRGVAGGPVVFKPYFIPQNQTAGFFQ